MKFSVLTYNILFNRAFGDINSIIENYHPDIICLQEVDTNENNLKKLENYGYRLAEYANSFIKFGQIFGVATFYNPDKFLLRKTESFNLQKGIVEVFVMLMRLVQRKHKPRSILRTEFVYKPLQKRLTIYNAHLSVIVSNTVRIKQVNKTFEEIVMTKRNPFIIAGDFNYLPYGRKNLERLAKRYGLSEATKDINYTMKYSVDGKKEHYNFFQIMAVKIFRKFFTDRLKIDYIFYKNLKNIKTKRIDIQYSDHYPILSTFEI